jgi:hypothetical protein
MKSLAALVRYALLWVVAGGAVAIVVVSLLERGARDPRVTLPPPRGSPCR